MELEVGVAFDEGDILVVNGDEWEVYDIHHRKVAMKKAGTKEHRDMDVEEIEEWIKYSGKFTLIREEYISVF
mgnify:CR=1 FL=1